MSFEPLYFIAVIAGVALVLWLIFRRTNAAAPTPERQTLTSGPSPDLLILGDPENPLFQIEPIHASDIPNGSIPADRSLMQALEPILSKAPEIFRLGGEAGAKSYKVIFSPEITRALSRGTLELVPKGKEFLPMVRSAGGMKRFAGQGRLVLQNGVKLANVAAMTWQIASIVTAQHYLEMINAKLAGIERGVDDIRSWLEFEKKGELRAAIHQLKEFYAAIARGKLNPNELASIYQQFDTIERQSSAIGELAREMARKRLAELDKVDVKEWVDRDGSAERAIKWVNHNKEVIDLIFLAQSVRVLTCQVQSMLPGDHERLRGRIENAREQAADGKKLFEATKSSLEDRVKELRKRPGNPLTHFDSDLRAKVLQEYEQACIKIAEGLERFSSDAMDSIKVTNQFQQIEDSGIELLVRIEADGSMSALPVIPKSP